MNEIVRHIEYLLTGNDCVVIPGLGAVIAHSLPARCDDSGLHMLPPGRTFSFNSSLTHNDGMLFSSVARAKDVTFEVAGKIVSAEVENMRAELHKTGSLSLGAAGRLVMLAETGALSFEPAPSASSLLTPAFMWLPELELTPVNSLARRRAAALAESLVSARRSLPAYIGKAVKVAASLAILIALGFVLTTPINIEQAQYASFGIENFKTRLALSDDSRRSELIRRPGELSSEIKLYLYNHNDAAETVDTAAHAAYVRQRVAEAARQHKASAAGRQVRFNADDRYCLVIASLVSEADALEFIENSKLNNTGILAKDGRYRVYAATGSTSREAQSAAAAFADRYPNAWVCRK